MLIFACQHESPQANLPSGVSPFFPIQFVRMEAYFCLSGWCSGCQSIFSYSIRAHGCLFCLSAWFILVCSTCNTYLSSGICKFNVFWVRVLKCLFLLVSLRVHPRQNQINLSVHFFLFNSRQWMLIFACQSGISLTRPGVSPFFLFNSCAWMLIFACRDTLNPKHVSPLSPE